MKSQKMIGAMVLGAALVGSFGVASLGFAPQDRAAAPQAASASDSFEVDSVHSSVVFKIQHMGLANFYGRFNDIAGSYSPAANGTFSIEIKTESVDSKNSKRDDHLRSPDFFNATEFPSITFKSTKVEKGSGDKLRVTGDLSLHGVTKPLTADIQVYPAKQTPQGFKGGFETTFTIKRTDFGMDTYVAQGGLGDEVTITVAVEGAKK